MGAPRAPPLSDPAPGHLPGHQLGLYTIFVHFEAVVHESIIPLLLPTTYIAHTFAILLHGYCAITDSSPTPLQ